MNAKPFLALGPIVLLAGAAAYAGIEWNSIPDRVPIHFGLNGQPDRWADRGILVFLPAIIGAAVAIPLSILSITATGQAGLMLASAWFTAALTGYLTVRPILFAGTSADVPWLIAGLIGAVTVFSFYSIRLRRLARKPPAKAWKLGLVYYNAADPALFVPERFGLGLTLNFANRWSWVILSPLLILPFVAAILR